MANDMTSLSIKCFYAFVLVCGTGTELCPSALHERGFQIKYDNLFGLKWEQVLQRVEDPKSYARPLTGALALILRGGNIFAFDEKTGRPLRQIALPSGNIGSVESIGDNRLAYVQTGQDVLGVVTVGLHDKAKSTLTRVPTGIQVYGLAAIPEMRKLVVGGKKRYSPDDKTDAYIADFDTFDWRVNGVWAGFGLVDGMSRLPVPNGIVGYRLRDDVRNIRSLNIYDAKTRSIESIRLPIDPKIVAPEAVKGNNVLMRVWDGAYRLRLYRNGGDLGIDFPTDFSTDLLDEGRGTIVVGINKEITTLNADGRVLQRFSTGGFDIQNVKYIEERDGNDVIAVTSSDASTKRLKLSVFGMKTIRARL